MERMEHPGMYPEHKEGQHFLCSGDRCDAAEAEVGRMLSGARSRSSRSSLSPSEMSRVLDALKSPISVSGQDFVDTKKARSLSRSRSPKTSVSSSRVRSMELPRMESMSRYHSYVSSGSIPTDTEVFTYKSRAPEVRSRSGQTTLTTIENFSTGEQGRIVLDRATGEKMYYLDGAEVTRSKFVARMSIP